MIPVVAALINAGLGILGNAVATKGKDFIEEKLNVNLDTMLGTESGRIQLAKLEAEKEQMLQQFALDKREQELRVDEMAYADTDSARKMQIAALGQTDVFSKRFTYIFASLWSLAASAYIGAITFSTIPPDNVRFADTILGFILGTVIATIINFFYGSSKQSQAKDSTIAEAVKGSKQ